MSCRSYQLSVCHERWSWPPAAAVWSMNARIAARACSSSCSPSSAPCAVDDEARPRPRSSRQSRGLGRGEHTSRPLRATRPRAAGAATVAVAETEFESAWRGVGAPVAMGRPARRRRPSSMTAFYAYANPATMPNSATTRLELFDAPRALQALLAGAAAADPRVLAELAHAAAAARCSSPAAQRARWAQR